LANACCKHHGYTEQEVTDTKIVAQKVIPQICFLSQIAPLTTISI